MGVNFAWSSFKYVPFFYVCSRVVLQARIIIVSLGRRVALNWLNGCLKRNFDNAQSMAPFKGNGVQRIVKLIRNVLIYYSCILMGEYLALLPVY